MKRTLVMDLECYRNYFLVGFKAVDSGKVMQFEQWGDETLDCRMIHAILQQYQQVTFNGLNYDMPLLFYALQGRTCSELKAASDRIINEQMRGWQFEGEFGIKVPSYVDHIDLQEPVPGVKISLKLYGGRLHSKKLQDLPYPHDATLTREQMLNVKAYNGNDLDTTIDLWIKARDPKDDIIGTRIQLTAESGVDVRSKSDAQIAEAIIKHRVQKLTGEKLYATKVPTGTVFKYEPPTWLKFETPELQAKLNEIAQSSFIINGKGKVDMPPSLRATKKKEDTDEITAPNSSRVKFHGSVYTMGIGGLHSTEKRQTVIATPDLLLKDVDVVSYYPSLILQCGLFPANMGAYFQAIYQEFFDRRVAAKNAGHKSTAQTLKIFLNGTFGKLGSPFSVLYAPKLLIQVTVTGQLALLMLIERFERAGIKVISANTDGVVQACPVALDGIRKQIVRQWERDTGLVTEETDYAGLFSRDVNNYIALKMEKGVRKGVKTKGVFTEPGVMKNPANTIIGRAVCDFVDKGVPIAETILGSKDVREFLSLKRVTGGATWRDEYQGKVVRWITSTQSNNPILYGPGKKLGHKVGGSDNARPVMELPDTLPVDIDYNFYIQQAHQSLIDIGVYK